MNPRINANVLYVGDLSEGGTCLQRMNALQELGCDVTPIHTYPAMSAVKLIYLRARHKIFGIYDAAGVNRSIVKHCSQQPCDVLWLDKGLMIDSETLATVRTVRPECRIVGYSPDDMGAVHNQSKQFLKHIKYYDIYFTTKSYGVQELKNLGCPEVLFIGNAYDIRTHKPMPVSALDRKRLGGPVGFIGTWENERAQSMRSIAESGTTVRIWGHGWSRQNFHHERLQIEGRAVFGEEYATAICAFDINLSFLRRMNRDKQTQRSVEVPACGGFMLAERTEEHLSLFKEGEEAEFFGPDEELRDKVRFYLENPDKRRKIAAAGRERCLKSGYSYHDRLREMFKAALNGVANER